MYIVIKKIILVIIGILLFSRISASQYDSLIFAHNSIHSIGVSFPGLNYPFLSSLNYSGYGITTHSNRFRDKGSHFNQLQLHFELGLLKNNATDAYITSLSFQGNWGMHWYLNNKANAFRVLCGGVIDARVDVYLKEDNTNNPVAYFFDLSLNPSIIGKYRFKAGNMTIDIGQQIDIPVVSLISMSGYSTIVPYEITEKDANFFDALRFASYGSLIKYTGITTVDFIPSRVRHPRCPSFRVSYIFTGTDYQTDNRSIKCVNQMVMVGVMFKLFRY